MPQKKIIKKRQRGYTPETQIPPAPPLLTPEEDADFKLALKLQEQYNREIQAPQVQPPEFNIRYEQDLAYNRSLEADRKKQADKLQIQLEQAQAQLEQAQLEQAQLEQSEPEKELTIEELRQIRIARYLK